MKVFKNFPDDEVCRLCKTSENKETVLVPILGTEENNKMQAIPVHRDCLFDSMGYSSKMDMFYSAYRKKTDEE